MTYTDSSDAQNKRKWFKNIQQFCTASQTIDNTWKRFYTGAIYSLHS